MALDLTRASCSCLAHVPVDWVSTWLQQSQSIYPNIVSLLTVSTVIFFDQDWSELLCSPANYEQS